MSRRLVNVYDIGPGDPYLLLELKHQLIAHELWSWMNRSGSGTAIGADHPLLMEEAGRIVRGHWQDRRERDWFEQAGISARRIYQRLVDLGAIEPNFTPRSRNPGWKS